MNATVSVSPKRKNKQGNTLCLQGELTVANAPFIKTEMMKALEEYNITSLRVNEVQNMDLSVLQLIYAIQRAARSGGSEISLDMDLPEETEILIRQSGLDRMFNLS
jgi:anti-anti-sigma factor